MQKLPHRSLGRQGLSVSTIGLGCMSLSGEYGAADDAESEDLIRHAIDRDPITCSSDCMGTTTRRWLVVRSGPGARVGATKFEKSARGQPARDGARNTSVQPGTPA